MSDPAVGTKRSASVAAAASTSSESSSTAPAASSTGAPAPAPTTATATAPASSTATALTMALTTATGRASSAASSTTPTPTTASSAATTAATAAKGASAAAAAYRKVIASVGEEDGELPVCFTASGVIGDGMPGLTVAGVGAVPLPVTAETARSLVVVAARSTLGHHGAAPKKKARLDAVEQRAPWVIGAAAVTLSNPAHARSIDLAMRNACTLLGIDRTDVRAILSKLLVIDEGARLCLPANADKCEPGIMFATMLVILPSVCTGGEPVVRYGTESVVGDIPQGPAAAYTSTFVAYYRGCAIETQPVTAGCRLMLVYTLNLDTTESWRNPIRSAPVPPSATKTAFATKLVHALQQWEGDPTGPLRLVTVRGDTFDAADGQVSAFGDAAAVSTLVRAASKAAVDVFIINLEKHQHGDHTKYKITSSLPVTTVAPETSTVGPEAFALNELATLDDGIDSSEYDKKKVHVDNWGDKTSERWYRRSGILLVRRSKRVTLILRNKWTDFGGPSRRSTSEIDRALEAFCIWVKAPTTAIDQGDLSASAADVLAAIREQLPHDIALGQAATFLDGLLAASTDAILRATLRILTLQPCQAFVSAITNRLGRLIKTVGIGMIEDATRAAVEQLPPSNALVALLSTWHAYGVRTAGTSAAAAALRQRVNVFVRAQASSLAARPCPLSVLWSRDGATAEAIHGDVMLALVRLATTLEDTTLATSCLDTSVTAIGLKPGHSVVLVDLARVVGWSAIEPIALRLTQLALAKANATVDAVLDLKGQLEVHPGTRSLVLAILSATVQAVCDGLVCAGDDAPPPPPKSDPNTFYAPKPLSPPPPIGRQLARLLTALLRLSANEEAAHAELVRLTAHWTHPRTSPACTRYVLGAMAQEVARALPEPVRTRRIDGLERPPWVAVLLFALERLAAGVASVAPPTDWTVRWSSAHPRTPADNAYRCGAELASFLQDPQQSSLALFDYRDKLQSVRDLALKVCIDVTCAIYRAEDGDKLVITKRHETHRQALEQAAGDIDLFRKLAGLVPAAWTAALPPVPAMPSPAVELPKGTRRVV